MNQGKLAICTIIAKNYVSFARTLCQSVYQHNPGIRFIVLIVDNFDQFIRRSEEPYELLSASDLNIDNLRSMAFKYNVTEFSTALKPYLLDHLIFASGIDRLLYLDPDILVTGSLSALFRKLDQYDFVVTPHIECDYPDDEYLPRDKNVLVSGIYNLGFLGVRRSESSKKVLSWWSHKLRDKCVVAPADGYFVDQRFIDLAMGMFPGFYVERDVAYNVAYWNLHSRHLSYEKGIWFCNERPLKFFHFSGYKPEHPGTVSKYTTRYMLQERKDIEPLFADYRKRLIQNQYMETQQWPYTFDRLPNGMQVTAEMRVRYREFLQAGHSELDPLSPEMFQVWQGDEAAQRKADGWTGLKGVARMLLPPVLWQSLGRGKKRLFHSAS